MFKKPVAEILFIILIGCLLIFPLWKKLQCNSLLLEILKARSEIARSIDWKDLILIVQTRGDISCQACEYDQVLLGQLYIWNNEPEKAIPLLDKYYELNKNRKDIAIFELSQAFLMVDMQAEFAEKYLQQFPTIVFLNQALDACQEDNLPLAKRFIKLSEKAEKGASGTHHQLGYCLWIKNEFDLALNQWRFAYELDPTSDDIRDVLVRSLIAKPNRIKADETEAERIILEAIHSKPWPFVWYRYAILLYESDRFQQENEIISQGIAYLTTAAGRNNHNGISLYNIGLLYSLKGDVNNEKIFFERALFSSLPNESYIADACNALRSLYTTSGEQLSSQIQQKCSP